MLFFLINFVFSVSQTADLDKNIWIPETSLFLSLSLNPRSFDFLCFFVLRFNQCSNLFDFIKQFNPVYYPFYFFFINPFKNFKTKANTIRTKIIFSIYLMSYYRFSLFICFNQLINFHSVTIFYQFISFYLAYLTNHSSDIFLVCNKFLLRYILTQILEDYFQDLLVF